MVVLAVELLLRPLEKIIDWLMHGRRCAQVLMSSVEGSEESSITQDEIGQRLVTALKQVWHNSLKLVTTVS